MMLFCHYTTIGSTAKKFFDNTVTDLGVFVLESITTESMEDFINHQRLELWEIIFFHEFKQKGVILKNKTWNQQIGGEEAFKHVVYK